MRLLLFPSGFYLNTTNSKVSMQVPSIRPMSNACYMSTSCQTYLTFRKVKQPFSYSLDPFTQVRYMWWCCLAFWVPCVSAWRLGVRIGERRPWCTYLVMGCCFTAFVALSMVLWKMRNDSWSMKISEVQLSALAVLSLVIGVCILLALIWAFYLQRRVFLEKIVQHEDSVSTCIYTCFCWPCSYGQMSSFAEENFKNTTKMSRS